MALILNIDTSGQEGIVALAKDGICIDSLTSSEPMQHASFLQPAIQQLMLKNQVALQELDAIAVSNGPGSYTGLRVGLASAKGLCFVLDKPLICINTLHAMAYAAKYKVYDTDVNNRQTTSGLSILFCPMIDARRMEVFFALYDKNMQLLIAPIATIIDTTFLNHVLTDNCIYFTGSGIFKWKKICGHPNAFFCEEMSSKDSLSFLSEQAFQQKLYSDIIHVEPFYYKEFYSPSLLKTTDT